METRPLGKNGPQVSIICFGAYPIGGNMGAVPESQAIATVQAAVDSGTTFIDTAEGYGTSESILGKALRGRRQDVLLATKLSGDHSPEHLATAIESSLRAMDTDYVDLYQLHSPKSEPIEETMGHLVRLRDAGKIRYIGISNFSAEQTREALEFGPIHSSQPRYNMLYRQAEESVLPFCLESGIGVMPHSVLAKGLLTGRYRPAHEFPEDDERRGRVGFYGDSLQATFEVTERLKAWAEDHGRDLVQLAIAWTLAHPSVTSPIVGAKSPEQARHNAKAADWRLTEADLEELDAIQGDVRIV
jgi:aryl-alcohol dehydrogenase-like predicted oxidoreductase